MSVQVTVGIVARNEGEYIAKTIESLMAQDFNPAEFEVILVDGNSEDDTREIARRILETSGIKYKVLNEKDFGSRGLCFARNLVIDQSSPESRYIAYTDADCILGKEWLKELYLAVEGSDANVVGAGGPRLIAPTKNMKELVINTFIASLIASGGNPAFSRRKIKFTSSIPNYNAIYKKDILSKFRYDDELIIGDDHDLNFRLRNAGYLFKYVLPAEVYHRETSSIRQFTKNMFRYGFNMMNVMKKHRRLLKVPLPMTLIFLFYLILLIPLYLIWGNIVFIPLVFYLIFALMSFGEVLIRTRTIYASLVFLLLPVQHIAYALGVIYSLFSKETSV
jgi:cellulose synthase/poly-beta-1,6-N-acetylglucosamine synthase-like glycosyltransferase